MDEKSEHAGGPGRHFSEEELAGMSTVELLRQITEDVAELARKQIELARTEMRSDLRQEIASVAGLALAGGGALIATTLFLVAAVLGLGTVIPGWAAGLIIAGFVACLSAAAALFAWRNRVRKPLAMTRQVLSEEAGRWKGKGPPPPHAPP
jgi:hypothetical protein